MNSKLKYCFIILFKVLVFFFLIYYLVSNNFIDFKNILTKLKFDLSTFLIIVFLFFSTFILASLRWYLLLRSINFKIDLKKIFEVIYISNFFNTILLGGYGGDIFRVYYISKSSDFNKFKLMATVLVDRIIGLIGLVSVGLFFLIFILGFEKILNLIMNINFNIALFFIILTTFFFAVSFFILKKIKGENLNIINILLFLKQHRFVFFVSYLLSTILFLITNLIVYFIAFNFFAFDITIFQIYFSNSLSILFNSLPLTPGGIGLGELSFVEANKFIGTSDLFGLANVIIVFRIINFIISLPALYLYLIFKNKKYDFK
jgi:uncharacterized membrane protein YbhN (UPF0104 family)